MISRAAAARSTTGKDKSATIASRPRTGSRPVQFGRAGQEESHDRRHHKAEQHFVDMPCPLGCFALSIADMIATLRMIIATLHMPSVGRHGADNRGEGRGDVMFVEGILPVARERLVMIRDDALLTNAAGLLDGRHINLVVACDSGGAMVGVVTKTDVVRQMSRCHGSGCTAAVATVMTRDVTYCRPGDLLHDVWTIMKERSLFARPYRRREFETIGGDQRTGCSSRPFGGIGARGSRFCVIMLWEWDIIEGNAVGVCAKRISSAKSRLRGFHYCCRPSPRPAFPAGTAADRSRNNGA